MFAYTHASKAGAQANINSGYNWNKLNCESFHKLSVFTRKLSHKFNQADYANPTSLMIKKDENLDESDVDTSESHHAGKEM
jgi:hypothetical protein